MPYKSPRLTPLLVRLTHAEKKFVEKCAKKFGGQSAFVKFLVAREMGNK